MPNIFTTGMYNFLRTLLERNVTKPFHRVMKQPDPTKMTGFATQQETKGINGLTISRRL